MSGALGAYTDDEITRAVNGFITEDWTGLTCPLGVFVRRAQIAHPDLFAPPAITDTSSDGQDAAGQATEPIESAESGEVVGEGPGSGLGGEAAHLATADRLDPTGRTVGLAALARIRARRALV